MAAAAYRAGTRLKDARTGRTYDYSRKQGIAATFVVAPPGAPEWAYDRAELWSRVELAEKHPRAATFREVLVSLPRELPPGEREEFVRRAIAPYVAAGAIADVALHEPAAADGDEQPHAHVLLTPRALDASRDTGFAKAKNATLEAMFESGGRHGGAPGEALRRERARWCEEINNTLRAVGSVARADHRSRAERGLSDAPEPLVGERDTARWRRQRDAGKPPQPSRRQQHVGAVRARRRAETALLTTELSVAREDPLMKTKQGTKVELLRHRFPDLDLADAASALHMVDVSKADRTRILTTGGGWVEVDHGGGAIRQYGNRDLVAADLARRLADAQGWEQDTVEWLPPALRAGRGPAQSPPTPEQRHSLAERWRERGYTDVTEARDGVWIGVGAARLQDTGNRVTVHGRVNDDAIRALAGKAKEEWGGRMEIWGPDDFKARAWLEAQRQGVVVTNFEPPERVREAWEREQAKTATARAAVGRVEDRAATARECLAYLRGESEDPPTPELGAYFDTLPKADRGRLAGKEPYELVPEVQEWQRRGVALAAEQPAAGPAAPKPTTPGRRPADAEDDGPAPPYGPPPPAPR
ncbi:MobA/MobL family protein [Azospirillum thermophilum]|uniref:MobA/MobL family protein n=1 Tax=Azospirillum thermophilum TaxID=2202148 RepID=UPI0011B7F793|nr:MobA/MobL family protein [Azospirillum thermophilum]